MKLLGRNFLGGLQLLPNVFYNGLRMTLKVLGLKNFTTF